MSKPTGLPSCSELERLVGEARAHRQRPLLDEDRARVPRLPSCPSSPQAADAEAEDDGGDRAAEAAGGRPRQFTFAARDRVSCSRAYSVTRTSACLADSRSLASTLMIGTSAGSARAWATSLEGIPLGVVELVDRHDERQVLGLEVVQRRERRIESGRVDQHDRADGAQAQVVPHEPEPSLAGSPEQVEHEILGQGQPTEVHGHGGGRLGGHGLEVVDALGLRRSPVPRSATARSPTPTPPWWSCPLRSRRR